METRYQVFVSSTFRDLQEERQAVMQALLELDCIPSGMELFPASDEAAWELIKRVIEGCDYYVVIVGGRYGAEDAEGVSYTEREYDHAVAQGIPVLGFVHADPAEIKAGKSDMSAEAQEKLARFREKVQKRHCKYWKNAEDLGSKVSRALVQAIRLTPREGWVRGRFASSPERINELRTRIDELERQVEESRIRPPVSAEGLAKGEEVFEVRYKYTSTWTSLPMTWDWLIATLGPLMLNEASEEALEAGLRAHLASSGRHDIAKFVAVNAEDFQTIKMQLYALGIIQQSERKRTASDTRTYWTLTPYGRHYTTTLKAIRSETPA